MNGEFGGPVPKGRNASIRKHSHSSDKLKNETTPWPFGVLMLMNQQRNEFSIVRVGVTDCSFKGELYLCYRAWTKTIVFGT